MINETRVSKLFLRSLLLPWLHGGGGGVIHGWNTPVHKPKCSWSFELSQIVSMAYDLWRYLAQLKAKNRETKQSGSLTCWRLVPSIPTAILWQKEATLEHDISCKWAKCVCHVHWYQCNITMSWLKYLSAGWVFLLQTWNGSRIC